MEVLGHQHNTPEWSLFIDTSEVSLKAVLLYNGNKYPSVPLAYAVNLKESYEYMKLLLEKIHYEKYKWNICGDLKVTALLIGLRLGYTKYCCFLCEWDSRDGKIHYSHKQWPRRDSLIPEKKNVLNSPLVNPEKVFLPPLHIKLGLMKNYVKVVDKNGAGFVYLKRKFAMLSDAKIIEGIFVGPQIRELIKDEQFEEQLNEIGNAAWQAFENVTKSFLGNHKAENCHETVSDILTGYKAMGCNMSL
jgi:hypothetical protein